MNTMKVFHKDYKLVDEKTGHPVQIGSEVRSHRGEVMIVTDWTPGLPPSTGRVYVKTPEEYENKTSMSSGTGYYPSVFDLEIIYRKDCDPCFVRNEICEYHQRNPEA